MTQKVICSRNNHKYVIGWVGLPYGPKKTGRIISIFIEYLSRNCLFWDRKEALVLNNSGLFKTLLHLLIGEPNMVSFTHGPKRVDGYLEEYKEKLVLALFKPKEEGYLPFAVLCWKENLHWALFICCLASCHNMVKVWAKDWNCVFIWPHCLAHRRWYWPIGHTAVCIIYLIISPIVLGLTPIQKMNEFLGKSSIYRDRDKSWPICYEGK